MLAKLTLLTMYLTISQSKTIHYHYYGNQTPDLLSVSHKQEVDHTHPPQMERRLASSQEEEEVSTHPPRMGRRLHSSSHMATNVPWDDPVLGKLYDKMSDTEKTARRK